MIENRETIPTPSFEIIKFDPKIDNLTQLQNNAKRAYQANTDFFTRDVHGIKISFLYSDQELIEAAKPYNFQIEKWHKAFAVENKIWIFSPNLPKGKKNQSILTHEMAHIFTNQLFSESNPYWLREGVAGVVANEYPNNQLKSNIELEMAHSQKDFQNHPIYDKSTIFVRYLIDQFKKDRLFYLLDHIVQIGHNNSKDDFSRLFLKTYNQTLKNTENLFIKKFNQKNE